MGERRGEALKLCCLLPWSPCFSGSLDWRIPKESLLELGPAGARGVGRKAGDLCGLLAMEAERRGTLQQVVCCRPGGERRMNLGGMELQSACLLPWLESVVFLMTFILTGRRWDFSVVLICISLMAVEAKHFSICCFFAVCVSSFENCFHFTSPFIIWVV